MKNIPKKIYLQIGGSDVTIDKSITDWNDLFQGAITWTDHRINDNDIEFVLSDVSQQRELLLAYNEEVNQCMVDSQDILDESDVNDFLANNCG